MIFSEESIKAILENRKSQTRRLVKEGENLRFLFDKKTVERAKIILRYPRDEEYLKKIGGIPCVSSASMDTLIPGKIKWQVGKSYAVQPGRGKPTVWYKRYTPQQAINGDVGSKPLRILITSIKKERLFDITEEDAKKEGFENRDDFLMAFYDINKHKKEAQKSIGEYNKELISKTKGWNPFVWVITSVAV